MTTPAEMQRKVRQLNNDVTSIYDLLKGIRDTQKKQGVHLEAVASGQTRIAAVQLRHGNRLDELAGQLEEIASTQAKFDATQERHGNRLDELAATQDEHTTKLDEHTTKLDEHTTKLDGLATTVDEHTTTLAEHTTKLDAILDLLRKD